MKKTFIGLAVLAMSLMPAAVMAQTQSKATDEKAKTEKVDNKKHPRKDKSERGDFRSKGGKHKPDKKNPGVCREQCIFETLSLTEDQKAKVKVTQRGPRGVTPGNVRAGQKDPRNERLFTQGSEEPRQGY